MLVNILTNNTQRVATVVIVPRHILEIYLSVVSNEYAVSRQLIIFGMVYLILAICSERYTIVCSGEIMLCLTPFMSAPHHSLWVWFWDERCAVVEYFIALVNR